MAEANSKILEIDGSLMEGVSITFVLQRHIKQSGYFIGCLNFVSTRYVISVGWSNFEKLCHVWLPVEQSDKCL